MFYSIENSISSTGMKRKCSIKFTRFNWNGYTSDINTFVNN